MKCLLSLTPAPEIRDLLPFAHFAIIPPPSGDEREQRKKIIYFQKDIVSR
jgi:hypothetical protein